MTTGKGEQRVKILMSRLSDEHSGEPAGTLLLGGLKVATGDGVLQILRLQREGKTAQDAWDFLNGTDLQPGDQFV